MTRAEIRIEAAKRRAKAAEAKLSKAYERHRAAMEAASKKTNPAIWTASRKVQEARQAVAIAELSALGITPMKTIILWHPKGYTSPLAQNRYVVKVTREGWKVLVPVGKKGAILKGRVDQHGPWDWSKVTVTGEELRA